VLRVRVTIPSARLTADHLGKTQNRDEGISLVLHHSGGAEPAIEVEQAGAIGIAAQHTLACGSEVAAALPRARGEKDLLAQPIHTPCSARTGIGGDRRAEALGQVRVTTGSVQYPLEQRAGSILSPTRTYQFSHPIVAREWRATGRIAGARRSVARR
jgi:hypothetical protein